MKPLYITLFTLLYAIPFVQAQDTTDYIIFKAPYNEDENVVVYSHHDGSYHVFDPNKNTGYYQIKIQRQSKYYTLIRTLENTTEPFSLYTPDQEKIAEIGKFDDHKFHIKDTLGHEIIAQTKGKKTTFLLQDQAAFVTSRFREKGHKHFAIYTQDSLAIDQGMLDIMAIATETLIAIKRKRNTYIGVAILSGIMLAILRAITWEQTQDEQVSGMYN